MNILFVMKHRGNAGNTHAVANYMRVAPKYGHTVAIYGEPQLVCAGAADSRPMSALSTASSTCSSPSFTASSRCGRWPCSPPSPKRHRLIFDMDGMYNPVIELDGYDFNHRSEAERARWIEYFDALADRVAKPTLAHARQRARQRDDVLRL